MDVSKIKVGDPDAQRARVIDTTTGETIDRVIEADAVAGKVRRFAVKDGCLVRDGDDLVVIDEDREIRIEITPADATTPAIGETAE